MRNIFNKEGKIMLYFVYSIWIRKKKKRKKGKGKGKRKGKRRQGKALVFDILSARIHS